MWHTRCLQQTEPRPQGAFCLEEKERCQSYRLNALGHLDPARPVTLICISTHWVLGRRVARPVGETRQLRLPSLWSPLTTQGRGQLFLPLSVAVIDPDLHLVSQEQQGWSSELRAEKGYPQQQRLAPSSRPSPGASCVVRLLK